LGPHRYRRPAIADEHHGRSLGSKSDNDRQESQREKNIQSVILAHLSIYDDEITPREAP
jgi:hypothetical protein